MIINYVPAYVRPLHTRLKWGGMMTNSPLWTLKSVVHYLLTVILNNYKF